jgi:hypothetical protein
VIVLVSLAYYFSARFAFSVTDLNTQATASVLYPAIGISLAAVLLLRDPVWVGVLIGALWFGKSLDGVTWVTAIVAAIGSSK